MSFIKCKNIENIEEYEIFKNIYIFAKKCQNVNGLIGEEIYFD